jgi:hypothetical protein
MSDVRGSSVEEELLDVDISEKTIGTLTGYIRYNSSSLRSQFGNQIVVKVAVGTG